MKRIITLLFGNCLLLFAASTCFAQMYTVTDVGTFDGVWSEATAINASGQVVGDASVGGNTAFHAFRTAANRPINPITDDLGTLGGAWSHALAINDSGRVVGWSPNSGSINSWHAFRTAANSPINQSTDDLGTLGGTQSQAWGINASGQVVGYSYTNGDATVRAFSTPPNRPIKRVLRIFADDYRRYFLPAITLAHRACSAAAGDDGADQHFSRPAATSPSCATIFP